MGYPFILKTSRGGYDGKGVWRVESASHLEAVMMDREGEFLRCCASGGGPPQRTVTKVSTEIGADLYVTGAAGSRLQDVAEASTIRFVAEAFVDRAYNADGTLVPRSLAGAVHEDLPVAVSQALTIALNQEVDTIDGTVIDLAARTLCVHSDSPEAAAMAGAVRAELIAHGVSIAPIADGDA